MKYTLEKTEEATKNEQSRDTQAILGTQDTGRRPKNKKTKKNRIV